MKKKLLVTGASGFIGSFIVESGLEHDMQVWAGMRKNSSRKYLQDQHINFIELDLTDSDSLSNELETYHKKFGKWDYIIHCAGVTKSVNKAEFEIGNYWSTRHFIETLVRLDMVPEQFVFLSSLSVFGPIHEEDYTPIKQSDIPSPDTAYGASKLLAEQYIMSLKDFPYTIFRPTGVYGPRERDYFLMVKSIARHVDFAAGFRRQDLTFVYVRDLVKAVFLGIEKHAVGRAYFVSDGEVYDSRTFSRLIQKELGGEWLIRFTCPLFLLKGISACMQIIANVSGQPFTLNLDKYRIMKQRNWRCDIEPLRQELGYVPEYPLDKGVKEIVAWYKKEKWL